MRKRDDVTDKMLSSIGAKHPSSLTLQQCSGSVTSGGLRDLFRQCADCLVVRAKIIVLTLLQSAKYYVKFNNVLKFDAAPMEHDLLTLFVHLYVK